MVTLTETDAAGLARFASVPVAPDRLPVLAAEFTAIAALIEDLRTADVHGIDAIAPPFDPTWPVATHPEDAAR